MVGEESRRERKITSNKAATRVGICPHNFNVSFPLGHGESWAYKSIDGSLIHNGERVAVGDTYGPGDTIGVLMSIASPHIHMNPSQPNEGSRVAFYKNGRLVHEQRPLKQLFYCFGVSLYNYSRVEVLPESEKRYLLHKEARHYYSVVNEPILYRDLQKNKLFKLS